MAWRRTVGGGCTLCSMRSGCQVVSRSVWRKRTNESPNSKKHIHPSYQPTTQAHSGLSAIVNNSLCFYHCRRTMSGVDTGALVSWSVDRSHCSVGPFVRVGAQHRVGEQAIHGPTGYRLQASGLAVVAVVAVGCCGLQLCAVRCAKQQQKGAHCPGDPISDQR